MAQISGPLCQTSVSKTLHFITVAKYSYKVTATIILLLEVTTTWGTVLKRHSIRKAEKHCATAIVGGRNPSVVSEVVIEVHETVERKRLVGCSVEYTEARRLYYLISLLKCM